MRCKSILCWIVLGLVAYIVVSIKYLSLIAVVNEEVVHYNLVDPKNEQMKVDNHPNLRVSADIQPTAVIPTQKTLKNMPTLRPGPVMEALPSNFREMVKDLGLPKKFPQSLVTPDPLSFILVCSVFPCEKLTIKHTKTAIIIRAKYPTKSQILRYADWFSTIENDYDFYIMLDEPLVRQYTDIPNFIYINYTVVMDTYPEIVNLRNRGNCKHRTFPDYFFYMWVSHTESILIWYNQLQYKYDYLWILEQDLGYSGKIGDFLRIFDNKTDDFIADKVLCSPKKYAHKFCRTEKYGEFRAKHNKNNSLCYSDEFIQRWSKNLIDILNDQTRNGLHAISESSVAEAAIYNKLSYSTIPLQYHGIYFRWSRKIGPITWGKINNNQTMLNKLYHALKF